ncbi:hypothetical protein NK294_23615, partial [Salmonella enterica]|nr:hypothetical protein [Salmonella enterica]
NSYDINYQLNNQEATTEKDVSKVKNVFVNGEASGNHKINMPAEESLEMSMETVEQLKSSTPSSEKATVITEKTGATEAAKSNQPVIHAAPTEEENPDESETLGT